MGRNGQPHRILTGMALVGCLLISPAMAQDAPVTAPASAVVIDGWGPLKFGMTMEQAIAAAPTMPFGKPCPRERLAKDGCALLPNKEGTVIVVGLPFSPTLRFDRFDRLDEIVLAYEEEGGVGAEACTRYYARVIAALETQYGVLVAPHANEPVNSIYKRTTHKSAGGTEYYLDRWDVGTNFPFLTTDVEAFLERFKNYESRHAPRSYLSMSALYGSSPSICSININYKAATMPETNQGSSSADNAKF